MFKNAKFKSATYFFYFNEVRSWFQSHSSVGTRWAGGQTARVEPKIHAWNECKRETYLYFINKKQERISTLVAVMNYLSSVSHWFFSLLRLIFNSSPTCLDHYTYPPKPTPPPRSFSRYRARGRKRRETWRGYTFLQYWNLFYFRLSFKYFISQEGQKHNFSDSNSVGKEWTDATEAFHRTKEEELILYQARLLWKPHFSRLDIVQDSTGALQMQNVFPARELYNSNPWWVLQLYFNFFMNFVAFQSLSTGF